VIEREDVGWVESETEGRSAVNLERLVKSGLTRRNAARRITGILQDFEDALEEEPSDFDFAVWKRNRDFNQA